MMEIGDEEEESGEMEADGILESRELIVNWTGIYDIILSAQQIEIDEGRRVSESGVLILQIISGGRNWKENVSTQTVIWSTNKLIQDQRAHKS